MYCCCDRGVLRKIYSHQTVPRDHSFVINTPDTSHARAASSPTLLVVVVDSELAYLNNYATIKLEIFINTEVVKFSYRWRCSVTSGDAADNAELMYPDDYATYGLRTFTAV
ncbi:hypothetical protein EDD15DRAFT_2191590 [Pisolithus albus]|nr:hypothetical protein EDD15DRAFT_2191590 [Pisolithus albus]